ncbi:bifunctional serine/threonine-protein kinase/formylglycine-generating enzyme family protein [Roseofilum casamattae]|uniref:Bifunctional serine/threonine-protein kinase/formylglycine-generating enzyme family protein n=1 Tax=Roseofilum casamattae BLCC-M143 TaxID=3022442 RepID=A0ABT7C4E3_9CYAN|nr:bifunctional serine/threonine-protein kinase/formylglycine-generating enzyme family protein [Roseofilum casamattae]MDJ1185794.1 bifunctional serine/threonine-protein kinase/formylglycine-generating enzyme family protein [Roseofilum casamattae BLCC-M143]
MGQVLASRYEIERKLSHGGFGQTYLASDRLLPGNPLCAVKQLNPKVTDPESMTIAKRLFETEAQVLQELGKDPHIPQLLAFFEQDNEFYLVQEYIHGHELSRELGRQKPWSEPATIQLLRDILLPLISVHERGIIHRDIKPTNLIRRSSDGEIVLIDFGAVKQTFADMTSATSRSIAIGSHNYMPSEQAIGRPKLSSDIYAVGAIAIQALTGKLLVDLPKNPDTENVLWQDFVSVSPELAQILNKMVAYHFGDRYPSAVEALEAIDTLPFSPVSRDLSQLQPGRGMESDAPTAIILQPGSIAKSEVTVAERSVTRQWPEPILDLIPIPGGMFLMGPGEETQSQTRDNFPQRLVQVSPFLMGKYPVTQFQWRQVASMPQVQRFLDAAPSYVKGDDLPVTMVSWYECQEFCDRLSRYTGNDYRLPSETEWEYACRAGTSTAFHCGDMLTAELANYDSNGDRDLDDLDREQTTPVGSFPANPFGLYDMHGNVWEWCHDCWDESDSTEPTSGGTWSSRVLRGGSWNNTAEGCRSWTRYRDAADNRRDTYGFRVASSY